MLKSAIEMGHTISSVAPLNRIELAQLIRGEPGDSQHPESPPGANLAGPRGNHDDADQLVDRAMDLILKLNVQGLETLLTRAAVRMPRHHFLQYLVLPIFAKIGELWANGEIKIIHEHMASVTVRAILHEMLRSVEVSRNAPMIVIATPNGHWHELGALASALAASESGWRVVYVGPSLPSEEIAYAVKTIKARALSLSVCYRGEAYKLSMEIGKIRRLLGKSLPIFIGGSGAAAVQQAIEAARAVLVDDLRAYRDGLEALL
jgi:methanogenic corrinoid protein MtbC1